MVHPTLRYLQIYISYPHGSFRYQPSIKWCRVPPLILTARVKRQPDSYKTHADHSVIAKQLLDFFCTIHALFSENYRMHFSLIWD